MATPSRYAVARTLHLVFGEGERVPESWDADLPPGDAGLANALLGLCLRRWGCLQAFLVPQLKDPGRGLPLGSQVALATGLALIMYQREESAEFLIDQLATDKDPILRYGDMHMVAMAYAGTANNAAIRRLLHVAVSDVSDDVRRAAVTSLG